jgi:Mycotoxin biosynthesis protein UstYa
MARLSELVRSWSQYYYTWRLHAARRHLSFSASSALILAAVFISIRAFQLEPSDGQCVHHSFSWSPALDQIEYHWETFDDVDFFTKTPYFGLRQTEDIEDVWNDLLPGTECIPYTVHSS